MNRFRWLSVAILFIIVSSLLPLAFTSAAQADSGKINLQDLTNGADSVLVGTVTDRNSYWNDAHTQIYTSVAFSVEDRIKGEAGPDKVTITVPGGEVEGIGEFVSEMPSFDQGEKAVVFLKKLTATQLHQAEALGGQPSGEQFEVYAGFRGKFDIKGDRIDNLPLNTFKGRVNNILKGQVLPDTELYVTPPAVTMPFSVTGYRWTPDKIPVGYRINENTSPCPYGREAVQNAASTWSDAGANFSFSYAGATTAVAAGFDGVNEIMWEDMGGNGILAMATWWSYDGSTIAEADIEFNDYYSWSASPTCPPGYYDAQSVGLHELGHWVGLADLYGGGDADKVMYGWASPGTTKRALTADDIAGIQSIYGASGSGGTQKLIGADAGSTFTNVATGGYFALAQFTAEASGTITELRVRCASEGNIKLAIYSDISGEPGDLLSGAFTASTHVDAGWNTIPFPTTTITAGQKYWLARNSDGNILYWKSQTGANFRYRAAAFSAFTFPATATALGALTIEPNTYHLMAGWGTVVIAPLDITTTSLPNGSVGTTYSQTLQATGGTTPYTWSKTAGALPAGLTLASTGVISGTPTTAGTYNFTVQVTDSTSPTPNSDTQALAITITPQAQKLIGADAGSTYTNVATGGYFALAQFTAEASGTITELKVRCDSSGNIKLAIYSDNSGEPGNLLPGAFTNSTHVDAGWNTIAFPSTTITAGQKYWLARNSDGNMLYWKAQPGANFRYRAAAFSTFTFPATATALGALNIEPNTYHLAAGWGTIVPPGTPTLVSPTTTINFQWSAPGGATKYKLQVNASSNFDGTSLFDAELGAVTSQQVTGLINGTTYYWHVRAGNDGGWGNWSTTRSVTVNQL